MPDIREILNALDDNDKRLWQQHRTEMRRSYLNAHNTTLGMAAWDFNDDAFLDLIDIRLAILFDRSGRFAATKDIVGEVDAEKIEADIYTKGSAIAVSGKPTAAYLDAVKTDPSSATKALTEIWGNGQSHVGQ
jgi:hypothetical protein